MPKKSPKLERQEVKLNFAPDISDAPIVCGLVRKYDIDFNIINAQIGPRREGHLTLELIGSRKNIDLGIAYLKEKGIKVYGFNNQVCFHEELCMHCGMCTSVCRVEALYVDTKTRLTTFVHDKCVACGLCTKVCPVNAMQMDEQQKIL